MKPIPSAVALLTALALVGCGRKEKQAAKAPTASSSVAEAPATPIPAPTDSLALVRTLYDQETIPSDEPNITAFFSRDLSLALMTDASSPETQAVSADYRYGAQDIEIADLTFEPYADGPDGSVIRAHFRNFGKPTTVSYELCRRPSGEWRIKDVSGPSGTLRSALKLPAAEAVEEC